MTVWGGIVWLLVAGIGMVVVGLARDRSALIVGALHLAAWPCAILDRRRTVTRVEVDGNWVTFTSPKATIKVSIDDLVELEGGVALLDPYGWRVWRIRLIGGRRLRVVPQRTDKLRLLYRLTTSNPNLIVEPASFPGLSSQLR